MRSILLPVCALLFAFSPCVAQGVSADARLPKMLSNPEPVYPPDALTIAVAGGTITVFAEIDRAGKVSVVDAFGPWVDCRNNDPRLEKLRDAAVDAANRAVFEPILKDGRPIETTVTLTYKIEAQQPPPKPLDPAESSKKYGGSLSKGHPISLPKPPYPSKARRFRAGGRVLVTAFVDTEGRVITVMAQSGHPLFFGVSAEAACRAKFTPTLFGGEPVTVIANINYNFVP